MQFTFNSNGKNEELQKYYFYTDLNSYFYSVFYFFVCIQLTIYFFFFLISDWIFPLERPEVQVY